MKDALAPSTRVALNFSYLFQLQDDFAKDSAKIRAWRVLRQQNKAEWRDPSAISPVARLSGLLLRFWRIRHRAKRRFDGNSEI